MERVQRVIRAVEPHDSAERYTQLGVECIQGDARITSPWSVEVNGKTAHYPGDRDRGGSRALHSADPRDRNDASA